MYRTMFAGKPDPDVNVYRRKRPAADVVVDGRVEPVGGAVEVPISATAHAPASSDGMYASDTTPPSNSGGRRKRPSPKSGPEDDEGFDEGAESPSSSSPGKKSKSLSGGKWSKYEDDCLRAGVEEVGAKNWKAISVRFLKGKRTDVQCLHRWQKVRSAVCV